MSGILLEAKPPCQVRVSSALEDPDWDAFLAQTAGGHHVQTTSWARVKHTLGWETSRICVLDDGQIVAGAQMLLRRLPLLGSVAYVSKGPLCHRNDPALASLVIAKILEVGAQQGCQLIVIQPPNNGSYMNCLLEECKFRTSSLYLAPTASLIVDIALSPEKILAQMKPEARKHVRRSERNGMIVREGTQADFDIFYPLYLTTSKRQGFTPYARGYFDTLWHAFAPTQGIGLLISSLNNEPVSAQLLIPFGDTVIAKMVGWSGAHSKCRPNDALFWASILWSIQRGYKYFDFEGLDPVGARAVADGHELPDLPRVSPDIIKYGYGGRVVFYPPAYSYLPNPALAWAYRLVSPLAAPDSPFARLVERFRKR